MKGNDEITGLFRSRLSGAEMTATCQELKPMQPILLQLLNVLSSLHASTGWLRRLL